MRRLLVSRRAQTVGLAVAMSLFVIWVGYWVRSESDQAAGANRAALEVEAVSHEIDTILWRTVAHVALERLSVEELHAAEDAIRHEVGTLDRSYRALESFGLTDPALATAYDRYRQALDRQLALLAAEDAFAMVAENRISTARAFAGLDDRIDDILPALGERSSFLEQVADVSSVVLTVFAALAAAVTVAWMRRIDAAEDMVESKDRFIATVSHELRTPLTGVLGLSRVLTDESSSTLAPEEQQELLVEISRQAQAMGNLVEDLLVSARSEIDQVTVQLEPTSIVSAVEDVASTLEPLLHKTLHIVADRDVVAAADPLRLRQVLRNLIMNAERHGGPSIMIRVNQTGHGVELVVADNGEPLSQRDRDRIFDPYQSSRNDIRPTGSVGLGLAVARELARRMGGDLGYRYRNGYTEFVLTFAPIAYLEQAG